MKRKSFYAAVLAAFSLLAACNKVQQLEPTGSSAGDFFKTVKVDLGAATKAVSESAVNDATLFVYQNNGKTGESILYHQVYGPGSTFEVDLLFSDQTTYTYDIKAYANMGELAAEGGEVLFTGESESGLQLHGQSLSVGEADASAVTVDMSRYVGKVTVSKVAVDWTNDHGQQDLKLVSVYLANVPGKVGGEPEYNVDGGFVSSAMDALIYRPVGSEIADGESYTTAQSMYGYAGTDCALVLECELAGEKMYYHVPYSPEANTHRAFRITIRQNGADTPLGELAQEAIEVSVVTLNVLGFDDSEQEVDFGSDNGNVDLDYNLQGYDLLAIIKSETGPTKICEEYSVKSIESISIDGVVQDAVTATYEFSDEGVEHIIKYKFVDSKSVPMDLLYGNKNLQSIKFSDHIEVIGSCAFAFTNLTKVEYPKSLKVLESGAFWDCYLEGDLVLPEGLTEVGTDNFTFCNLTSLHIPASLVHIEISMGLGPFIGNPFKSITVHPDNPKFENRNGCLVETITNKLLLTPMEFTFSDDMKVIGQSALSCCTMEELSIPTTITHIEDWAFYGSKIKSITIPKGVEIGGVNTFAYSEAREITIASNDVVNVAYMFMGCKNLETLDINFNMPYGNQVVNECPKLNRIKIGPDVTIIGGGEAVNAPDLESIEVSDENDIYYVEGNCLIEKDEKNVILGCKNSVIPNNIVGISVSAFSCSNIQRIELPNTLKSIGLYAFSGCKHLNEIVSYITDWSEWHIAPEIDEIFLGVSEEGTLFSVPTDSKPAILDYPQLREWNLVEI